MPPTYSTKRNPWWIPPFLGGIPDVGPRLLSVLGLVSLALFFEQYDNSMLTSALKFIARDLAMTEGDLGSFLAIIKLGAVPAFLVVPFADRIGRRRVFLASVVGCSVGTFLTAFTQTVGQFVVLQMMTRAFMLAAAAVAFVIVTEEFPAAHRGWAVGMLGALSACGHGLGAALFAAIEHLPYGWRSLYVVGAIPLLLLPAFSRGVPETRRFTDHRAAMKPQGASDSVWGDWYRPMLGLFRTHPLRVFGLAVVGGLFSFGEASVFQFTGYFTMTVHGWSPGQFSLMFVLGGAVGIIGNVVAGRLGDVVGRRTVGFAFLALFPLSAGLFYNGSGWVLPIAWTMVIFCTTAGSVTVRAFSTELFPTSHRGTAAAWLSLVQTLGWAAGLAVVGSGIQEAGDMAVMTTRVSMVVFGAALALLFLPETFRQELEILSHEEAPTSA